MYIFIVKIVIFVKIVLNNLMLVNDRQRLKYTEIFQAVLFMRSTTRSDFLDTS